MEAVFVGRRQTLAAAVRASGIETFALVLFSGFDCDPRQAFRVDNNFFYLTGYSKPNIVAIIDQHGDLQLWGPNCSIDISAWESNHGRHVGVTSKPILPLGQLIAGYALPVQFKLGAVENLMQKLQNYALQKAVLLSCQNYYHPDIAGLSALWFFNRLNILAEALPFQDITPILTQLRTIKDAAEISLTQAAVDVCIKAQMAAIGQVRPNCSEQEVKWLIEQQFEAEGSMGLAFSSIVAAGANATVLHHLPTKKLMSKDELVVIDVGCQVGFYSSDITRTLPVGGRFSAEQARLYEMVLSVQQEVERAARPGSFLRGNQPQGLSLHQLAVQMFKDYGYEKFFIHSIGHYLGLEVHDVGNYDEPIPVGAVFTIEPGIYLPKLGIGIRIEDNYLMTPSGAVCLSSALPKGLKEIEDLMQR